jgi:nucleotide-binding universal stress UspA family protein
MSETIPAVAIRNVAVATDLSPCSEHAVEHGLALARHFGATLHFLHLLRPSQYSYTPDMLPALSEAADRDCHSLLARLRDQHRLDGIDCRLWVEQGEITERAGAFVRDRRIDLLILGTHGRSGLPHLLLGSVAQQIFQCVPCPVLTVGPRSPGAGPNLQLHRILFSTDLSPQSLAAVPFVVTAAREWHAQVDLLHVCASRDDAHLAAIKQLRTDLDRCLDGAHPQENILAGNPADCVLAFTAAHHDDLIVLGLKPRRALYNGRLWSHAYEIVRRAPCPVLSVRSPVPSG